MIVSGKTSNFSEFENFVNLMVVLVAVFPVWLLAYKVLRSGNKWGVLNHDLLLRTIRALLLSPVFGAIIIVTINISTFITFNFIDENPFALDTIMVSTIIASLILFLTDYFLFEKELKLIQLNTEKDKNKQLQLKNQVLKNQINPHFLFNSLNVLSSLIFIDQIKANLFTKELSKLYRYSVKNTDRDIVFIKDEVNFIQAYSYILHLRFQHQIHIMINGDIPNGYIVPMTLQLLIENAQKHNDFNEENPLDINIEFNANSIVVINNLNPKTNYNRTNTNMGLHYIREMYKKFNLQIGVVKNNTSFLVELPLIQY